MTSGPRGGGPDEPGGEWNGDDLGGWVPPEERTWRHPSEMHAGALWTGASGPAHLGGASHLARAHDRRGATLVVGTAAAAAIVVGLLLLLNTGTAPGPTVLDTMPVGTAAITQCCRLAASLASDDEASMVSIQAAGSSRPAPTGCGVVVGDGRLLATTVDALHGARQVRAVSVTGEQLTATLVATDPGSGLALLRLSGALRTAPVDQISAIGTGSHAMAVSMATSMAAAASTRRDKDRPRAVWSSGTVVSVDPVGAQSTSAMAAITVHGPSVPAMPGEALVDSRGGVVGMLAGSTGPDRSFLPMQLVIGVSDDLETMGRVRHGWLDVRDVTAAESGSESVSQSASQSVSQSVAQSVSASFGAMVVSVDPQGASAGTLEVGDVIVGVDGNTVMSSAELRDFLYVMAPGTKVSLDVLRDGRPIRAVVQLSPSP